jgi:hypothetical protein
LGDRSAADSTDWSASIISHTDHDFRELTAGDPCSSIAIARTRDINRHQKARLDREVRVHQTQQTYWVTAVRLKKRAHRGLESQLTSKWNHVHIKSKPIGTITNQSLMNNGKEKMMRENKCISPDLSEIELNFASSHAEPLTNQT